MTPGEHPQACIKYMEWCENDPALMAYQAKVAAMGRQPVMGEYRMAKLWMDGARERVLVAKAESACARYSSSPMGPYPLDSSSPKSCAGSGAWGGDGGGSCGGGGGGE